MEVRVALLEQDMASAKECLKEFGLVINGDGKEEGMKAIIARADEKMDMLNKKMDTFQNIGYWIIGLILTGVLSMVWEGAKKVSVN